MLSMTQSSKWKHAATLSPLKLMSWHPKWVALLSITAFEEKPFKEVK